MYEKQFVRDDAADVMHPSNALHGMMSLAPRHSGFLLGLAALHALRVARWRFPLQVALQGSAMDPTTGTIDMDLIQTGISAGDRTLRAQLTQELRALIQRASTAALHVRLSLHLCLVAAMWWRQVVTQIGGCKCAAMPIQDDASISIYNLHRAE